METVLPAGNPGPYPTSHYDIGYDQGGNCICTSRRITGWLTDFVFGWDRWFVRVGLGIVSWALGFHIADALETPAMNVAAQYGIHIIGPLGLPQFFLLLSTLWGGFLAFTGRLGRGITEVGISLVIGAIAATYLVNPAMSLMGMLHFTEGMSLDLAAVSTGGARDSRPTNEIGTSMAAAIHHSFIERPHEIINWGRPLPPGDPCLDTYNQYVATGPWGTSSKPRVAMKEAGCKAEDKFNRDPSSERLGVALLTAMAGALVMVLLVMVSFTLVAAQLGVILAIAVAPFGLLFGTLPGRGRTLFWRWVASAAMALVGVMMMSVLLSLTLVTVDMVLGNTLDAPLMVQMGVVDLVVIMALVKRKRLLSGGRHAVGNFAQRMSGTGGARSQSWVSSAGAGFAGGVGAATGFRAVQNAARHHGHNARQRALVRQGDERAERERGSTSAGTEHLRELADTFNSHREDAAAFHAESLDHQQAARYNSERTAEALDDLRQEFADARS